MSCENSIPRSIRSLKPATVSGKAQECRPRPSAADLAAQTAPAELDPSSRPPRAIDHTAVRFRPGTSNQQIANYYRRRRHLFGWPAFRNAPPT